MRQIAILPGDGIGPEVTAEAVRVLEWLNDRFELSITFSEGLIGGAAIDVTGHPLPPETLSLCRSSAAVLLGAVGGPKWEMIDPPNLRPERGALLPLRQKLGLFCNLRPVKISPSLANLSPLKERIISRGIDLLIVRELTGGIYFGSPSGTRIRKGEEEGFSTMIYRRGEVERIARRAFSLARERRGKVASVDKANVLEVSGFWRRVVNEIAREFSDVTIEHLYVDNAAMQLIVHPEQFDVILTSNLFGDILSDEASVLGGSIGLLPSASLGSETFGLYEPIHGSAPDIAGKDLANPVAAILSGAMLMRHSLGRKDLADLVEKAVDSVLGDGIMTHDLASGDQKPVGCQAMGEKILDRLSCFLTA